MQKIDLKLLITALKSIGFTVLATLVLATLHWTGAFPVEAGSWRFLLMLVGFFIVHWIVRVALVTYQSDKAEATRKSKAVMWGAAAAATLLLFMLIFVLLYVISPNDFFVVDPLNFFVGFAIIAGIIVLAHIIDYIVRITIRTVKYGDQIPDYKEGQKIANGDFGGQGLLAEQVARGGGGKGYGDGFGAAHGGQQLFAEDAQIALVDGLIHGMPFLL